MTTLPFLPYMVDGDSKVHLLAAKGVIEIHGEMGGVHLHTST